MNEWQKNIKNDGELNIKLIHQLAQSVKFTHVCNILFSLLNCLLIKFVVQTFQTVDTWYKIV